MDRNAIEGLGQRLVPHKPTSQIPISVPVMTHFQYILENTPSEFVALVCATQWINMVGSVRDAHAQKFRWIRSFEHTELFYSEEG